MVFGFVHYLFDAQKNLLKVIKRLLVLLLLAVLSYRFVFSFKVTANRLLILLMNPEIHPDYCHFEMYVLWQDRIHLYIV